MSRNLGSDLLTALNSKTLSVVVMIEMYFDSGNLFLWSGNGNISYGGKTYVGGAILGIGVVNDSSEAKSDNFVLTLSGIPTEYTSLALSEHFQGRKLYFYLSLLDSSGNILTPFIAFKGQMDTMSMKDDAGTSTISLSTENRLNRLFNPKNDRYTDECQRISYPDDGFFKYVPSLQNILTDWGLS